MSNSHQPAFPINPALSGLTKREYMATHIMAGLIANPDLGGTIPEFAHDAIKSADALLEELEK